ncbi:phosphatase PAP2 family protein, partial [Streptomyces sp. NPDC054804]
MRDTPRSQGTVGDFRPGPPQLRPGRALAHTTGASGSGSPHRSDGRSPQTPRGARRSDPVGGGRGPPPPPRRPPAPAAAADPGAPG